MEITLRKPIMINDVETKKIVLNFDEINGEELLSLEKQIRMEGETGFNVFFTTIGLLYIASKASGILVDDLKRLDGPDFLEVRNEVFNFLYA